MILGLLATKDTNFNRYAKEEVVCNLHQETIDIVSLQCKAK